MLTKTSKFEFSKHVNHNLKYFEYNCRCQLSFEISESETIVAHRKVYIFYLKNLTFTGRVFFVNYIFCHMFAHPLILILNYCRSHNSIRWQIAAVINHMKRLTDD